MLNLCKYQELQNDLYTELSQFANKDDESSNESSNGKLSIDLETIWKNCIKLRAFVHETLRISNSTARGLPRSLTTDCIISFKGL